MLPAVSASARLRAGIGALVVTVMTVACTSAAPIPSAGQQSPARAAPQPSPAMVGSRFRPAAFGGDVILATQQALAHEGVGTFDLSSGTAGQALVAVVDPASPLQLTTDQVHAIALDAWSGAGVTGASLDDLVNTPPGAAPPSVLLAAYVDLGETADATPGAQLAAQLVGHVEATDAAATSYPLLVLSLLVADLTRYASSSSHQSGVVLARDVAGGLCSAVTNFVDQSLSAVFNAVRSNGSGFFSSLWNVVVSIGQSVVSGLIKAVTAPVVEAITHIVGVVAIVVNVVSILRPWTLKVTPDDLATRFSVGGQAPIEDAVHVVVDLGGLDSWPPVLQDCAQAAGVALPDLKPFGAPVVWTTPVQLPDPAFPILPLVTIVPGSGLQQTLASDGSNVLRLDTGHEDTDTGDPHDGRVKEGVTVHRPGLDTLKQSVTGLIVNGLPDIVRGVVASIVSGPIDTVIAKIAALTDASGNTQFTVTYHAPPQTPAPTPPQTPNLTPCSTSGGSIAPGNYSGTVTWEVHQQSGTGNVTSNTDISGTGPINVTVADNGSMTGTWSLDEKGGGVTKSGVGTTSVQGSGGVTAGAVGGTTQQMAMQGSVSWTQTLSVNGVPGNPATITYPWPYPLLLVPLATDCSGNVSASWQPIAGAQFAVQLHRTS